MLNLENYNLIKAFINSRSNKYNNNLENIYTENAFLTYIANDISGYDVLNNSDELLNKQYPIDLNDTEKTLNFKIYYEKIN